MDKKMIWFSFKLSRNYAIDISGFHCIRSFKDGITGIDFSINLDTYEGDHNPKCALSLIIFNFKLFEIEIYNIKHI